MRVRDHRSETHRCKGITKQADRQIPCAGTLSAHRRTPQTELFHRTRKKLTSPHLPQHTRDRFSSLHPRAARLSWPVNPNGTNKDVPTRSRPPSQPHIRSVHYARRRAQRPGRNTGSPKIYAIIICNHVRWCSMALRERGWGRPHPTPQGTSSASMRKRLFRSLICSVVSFPCCAWAPSTFRGSFAPRWRFTCHQPGAGKTMHPALARLLA